MITLSPAGNFAPTTIGGKSVFQTSVISRVRNTDETTVYHGNPAYIVIGDRMGTTFEANPFSETEWKKGQISLRLLRRVGILIWVPGYFTKLTAVEVTA
jgi:HK97 family phage major capsid protein